MDPLGILSGIPTDFKSFITCLCISAILNKMPWDGYIIYEIRTDDRLLGKRPRRRKACLALTTIAGASIEP
jgi:hypothetical protein